MNAEVLQLALPDFQVTDSLRIPETKEKGERYLPLSLSRLELAARYLDNPDEPVKDPRAMTLDQHLNILSGLTIHHIVQATSLWRTALPSGIYGYQKAYQQNLSRLIDVIPTTQAPSVRLMLSFLGDERLAMPRIRGQEPAKRKVYEIITDKVLSWMRSVEPFTDTPAFPQFSEDPRLVGEIPFPDPVAINCAWDREQKSQLVHQRVDNLFAYHQSKAVLPTDFARHGNKNYFSELRLFGLLHNLGAVWTTRLDELTIGAANQVPSKHLKVVDYKLSQPFFPEEGTYQRQALFLSTWLTAMGLMSLKDGFAPTGRAIQVSLRPTFDPDTKIEIIHLGLATDPPTELNLSEKYEYFWTYEGRSWQTYETLSHFTQTLRANLGRLAPIFS